MTIIISNIIVVLFELLKLYLSLIFLKKFAFMSSIALLVKLIKLSVIVYTID